MLRPTLVRWVDAYGSGHDQWEELDRVTAQDPVIVSVGMLVREDERFVTLALSYGNEPPQVNGTIAIPRAVILEIVALVAQED